MNDSKKNSWDRYWDGVNGGGAYSNRGVTHPSLQAYWQSVFDNEKKKSSNNATLIDIASGNGALANIANEFFDTNTNSLTCIDLSSSAIDQLKSRLPNVNGIVSDITNIPLEDSTANFVTSQFGIEYAHKCAFKEAARLVASGGAVIFMLHCHNGAIFRESEGNLVAIDRVIYSNIFVIAKRMFNAAFSALETGDRISYELESQAFAIAIKSFEQIMREYGKNAAGGFVFSLYNDFADIHENLGKYRLTELLEWLNNIEIELSAYRDRMSSMLGASLDNEAFADLVNDFQAWGFSIITADKLYSPDSSIPLAWIFHAKKQDV